MGEYADDILNGLVCQSCGEFFDDIINGADEPGFPRTCEACDPVGKEIKRRNRAAKNKRKRQRKRAKLAAQKQAAP